ncbi:MAG: glycosyltransferase family 2 protein [Chlamydiales bacterium]|jgi:GT2 family glycosyltransferase|nr:glycosyltransferase family 2 protein [Chlamydiales bacterium]
MSLAYFPKIFIIIVNWNGKQDTLTCLTSLHSLDYSNYQIVVVDNGSTDGSISAIKLQFPHHLLIENQTNLGFTGGNNIGIRYALDHKADFILLLNNDTKVSSDLLKHFILGFQEFPQAGILGAKICLMQNESKLDHFGGTWNPKKGIFDLIGLHALDENWNEAFCIDYVCGAAMMIKKEVFEQIGLLESRFFLIWEESDFCMRAKHKGFQIISYPSAKIWHKVSASFKGKTHNIYFWWRNRLLWIERNCAFHQLLSIYIRVLIPEILQLLKIYSLKSTQFICFKHFYTKDEQEKKRYKLFIYKAALKGIKDYFLRRFGPGPDWVYHCY